MPAELATIEGNALHVHRALGCEGARVLDLHAALRQLGVEASPIAPRGCRGELTGDPLVIRFDGRGAELVALDALTHEVGHLVQAIGGERYPHNEDGATWAGACALMPRAGALRVYKLVGLDPAAIVAAYPEVLPSRALGRVALAAGAAALFYARGARDPVVVAERCPPLGALMLAYQLATEVHATGKASRCGSMRAGVYVEPGRRGASVAGVVVTMEEETT